MQTGRWALLSLHLPGRLVEPVGIILCDDADHLHVKLRSDWPNIADIDQVEICRGLAGELEQKGRNLGGATVFDWLEHSASHAIQIGSPTTVHVVDASIAVEALYQRHVADAEGGGKASQNRYRVHVAVAAVLLITAVGTLWNHFRTSDSSSLRVFTYASVNPPLLLQLPHRPDVSLGIESVLKPAAVAHWHRSRQRIAARAHRVFRLPNMPFERRVEQPVEIAAPPLYEITELNSALVLDFSLPDAPPLQIRRNRFVRFLSVMASSVKRLFSSQPAGETVLN
jgi:hypothetical protein